MKKIIFALVLVVAPARADDPRKPSIPATLPDVTHSDLTIAFEETLGLVTYHNGALQGSSTIDVDRFFAEVPIPHSHWYVGAAYDFALGHDDVGGSRLVSGNPEIFGRGVWSAVYGLSFGGGLGLVVPTKSYALTEPAATTAFEAITARGWERALFDPDDLTLRPFLDVRLLSGPVTVQYRQALELATDFSSYRFAAVGTVYFGVRLSPLVTTGLEIIEHYRLDPDLDDDQRSYFAVGAHVRLDTRYVRPSLGFMTNIGSPLNALSHIGAPLSPMPTTFVGMHVGLEFSLPIGNTNR